jgi:LruC domain-containing protein
MTMNTNSNLLRMVAVAAGLGLVLGATSCGGGSASTTPGQPQQGTGELPGAGSGGGNTTGGSSLKPTNYGGGTVPLLTPQGVTGDALLGTEPEYQVEAVGGSTENTGRGASVVGGEVELTFEITDITMAKDNVSPNWDATTATFKEGEAVDLYMKYHIDPNFPLNRKWTCEHLGLEFVESNVPHATAGDYTAKLDFAIPWGTVKNDVTFNTTLYTLDDSETSPNFTFNITSNGTTSRSLYPQVPNTVRNDSQGGGCKPSFVQATFNGTTVTTTSAKDLSNVVLKFADGTVQKWDSLNQGKTGTFYGTGANAGKTIIGVWIKSGCNASGDGPGYGEYLDNPQLNTAGDFNVALAQMAFEDLITGSDYDYNDFVGRINSIETRNSNGDLVQIQFTLKAVARSAGYDSDWQFNINGAFPGAQAMAIVNQYYTNGTRHGPQKLWKSSNGASVPVFTPIRSALPNPPGSYATNGIPGTQYIDGDYAEVTVIFSSPVAKNTYTPAPYSPQLRVSNGSGGIWTVNLWKQKGDPVDSTGRPLAFIVPDTYAWPLEGKAIWNSFTGFNAWIAWINNNGNMPTNNWWDNDPVQDYFRRELFN